MDYFSVGHHPPPASAELLRSSRPFPLKSLQLPTPSCITAPFCEKEHVFKSARSSIFQPLHADIAADQLHPLCFSHSAPCQSSALQHGHLLQCIYNPSPTVLQRKFSIKISCMLKSSENGRPPVSSPSSSSSTSAQSSSSPSPASPTVTAMAKALLVSEEQEAALSHLLSSKSLIEFITRVPSWADIQKESGMAQRQQRAFYSHQDWLQHRSSLRHMRHMLSSGSSRVILSLIPPVFTVTAISVVIASYNTAVNLSVLPTFFPLLHAASLPYELTAPAIALMLVFRTDASYSRYDEARKTWNKVLSTTEDFVRLSLQLIHNPQDVDLQFLLLTYVMAFPISLKVGVIIEEPFPMLALDKMIGLVHENIREMLKSHQTTKEHICKLRTKDKSWRGLTC